MAQKLPPELLEHGRRLQTVIQKITAGKKLSLEDQGFINFIARPRLGIAPNLQAASKRTGLSVELLRLAKAHNADGFYSNGRIDCDDVFYWLLRHPEIWQGAADAINVKDERALFIRAKRMREEHKLLVAKREYIGIDEVRRTLTRAIIAAKSRLFAMENNAAMLASIDLGLSSDQVNKLREILTKENREAMFELSKSPWGKCECPHCGRRVDQQNAENRTNNKRSLGSSIGSLRRSLG